jgi:hypothetical protein
LHVDNDDSFEVVVGREKRLRDPERMKAPALAAAAGSDDDEGMSRLPKKRPSRKHKVTSIGSNNPFESLDVKMSSDADDDDFIEDKQSGSDSRSSEPESDIEGLKSAEVPFEFTQSDC